MPGHYEYQRDEYAEARPAREVSQMSLTERSELPQRPAVPSSNKGKQPALPDELDDDEDDFYSPDTTLKNATLREGEHPVHMPERPSSFFGGFDSGVDTSNSPLERLAQNLKLQQQELYRSRDPSPGPPEDSPAWPRVPSEEDVRPDRPPRHPEHHSNHFAPDVPPKDHSRASSTHQSAAYTNGHSQPFEDDEVSLTASRPEYYRQRTQSTPMDFMSSREEPMPIPGSSARPQSTLDPAARPNSFYGLDRPDLYPQGRSLPINGQPYSHAGGPSSDRSRSLSSTSRSPSTSTLARHVDPDTQPIAAYLMDQSHLKPGARASLLSHAKTLELYRANVKKTNEPDVIYEFAIFMLDTAKELADLAGTSYLGASVSSPDSNDSGSSTNSRDDISSLNVPGNATEKRGKASIMSKSKSAVSALSNSDSVPEAPPLDASTANDPQKAQAHCRAMQLEAAQLLRRIADRGHVAAQAHLGDMYSQGLGLPKGKPDYDRAFPLFVLAGKHGNIEASYRTGQCCEKGWGCRKDNSKAVQWYRCVGAFISLSSDVKFSFMHRKAAAALHPLAMLRLGIAEINGELALPRRPREGFKWLKRTAELTETADPPPPSSIEALYEIARLHEKGIEHVVFVDFDYAAECLARASELGHAPSAYKLGECYEYGRMGCPQDSALSIHYYSTSDHRYARIELTLCGLRTDIAAQKNHREACFALTAWYLVGSPGVLPQSDTEAYLWAKRAANMGLPKAEYAMGYFTEVGQITTDSN